MNILCIVGYPNTTHYLLLKSPLEEHSLCAYKANLLVHFSNLCLRKQSLSYHATKTIYFISIERSVGKNRQF